MRRFFSSKKFVAFVVALAIIGIGYYLQSSVGDSYMKFLVVSGPTQTVSYPIGCQEKSFAFNQSEQVLAGEHDEMIFVGNSRSRLRDWWDGVRLSWTDTVREPRYWLSSNNVYQLVRTSWNPDGHWERIERLPDDAVQVRERALRSIYEKRNPEFACWCTYGAPGTFVPN